MPKGWRRDMILARSLGRMTISVRAIRSLIRVAVYCLVVSAFASNRSDATQLYDLNFTPSEVGTYSTVLGSPTVVPTFEGLSDALLFHAVTSYDQIELNLGVGAPGYQIGFDIVCHGVLNSQYDFAAYLDTPQIRSLNFHGGLNSIYVFQPVSGSGILEPLVDDSIHHVDMTVDVLHNLWTIAVDNTPLYSNSIGAADIQDVRFSMAPWVGGATNSPDTQVAIDNVVISTIPEPAPYALVALGCLAVLFRVRKNNRPPLLRTWEDSLCPLWWANLIIRFLYLRACRKVIIPLPNQLCSDWKPRPRITSNW